MQNPNDQMQMILNAHADMGPLPIETLTPDMARQIPLLDRAAVGVYGHHITKKAFTPFPVTVGRIEHAIVESTGGNILARVYTPPGNAPDEGWPVLVYYHGGGWVIADLNTYDSSCRALCVGASCVVVSFAYRQAPENPFPAAVEDAFSGYTWVLAQAATLGWDENHIAIGGESAGGNLAAVVSLMARDQAATLPVHQLLVYPVTDMMQGSQSPSVIENAHARPLNAAMLEWFYSYYAGNQDRTHPFLSPLYAESHAGLPPATIINAQIDPLRHDGEAYAAKLSDAGVPTKHKLYEGVTHEFFGLAGLVNEATEAVAFAAKELKEAFTAPVTMVAR